MNSIELRDGERIDEINEKLSLIQKIGGLTFSTDAYLLAAFAKKNNTSPLVDLGGGTGVIPLLCIARDKFPKAYAVEIQPDFAELINRNAALNSFDDRVRSVCKDARDVSAADFSEIIRVVTSNPPYLKDSHGFTNAKDEMAIARRELNGNIFDFCACASRILTYGGLFYTVFIPDRLTDLLCALRAASLEPKRMVTVYPDSASKPCLVLVEAKKGAEPSMVHSAPLIIYNSTDKRGERVYTDNMQRIYDTFSLDFLFR